MSQKHWRTLMLLGLHIESRGNSWYTWTYWDDAETQR
jgi:hypothetical protein